MTSPSSYVRKQTLENSMKQFEQGAIGQGAYQTIPQSQILSRTTTYVRQPKDYSQVGSKVRGNMKSQNKAR
jgi:hypothetical protein